MANATRKPTGPKKPDSDHAALTLLDAAFCVSPEERERLVRKAFEYDGALRRWASQWTGAANESDAIRNVALEFASFLESFAPGASPKRRGEQSSSAPLSEPWRIRLAAVAARLATSEPRGQDFDDRLATAKLDALKEFAYGAGHEINNPLANISARAQTLLRDETHGERRRMLATINRQAMRAHEMIADLMLVARPSRLELAEVDAAKIVGRVVNELAPLAAAQATRLTFEEPPSMRVAQVDGVQFGVAIKALVRNAIEAVAAGGNVEVDVRCASTEVPRDRESRDAASPTFRRRVPDRRMAPSKADADPQRELLEVTVRDDGPGLSPREQAHLFDPFFSGREAGRGLGFGLCLAWRIVADHGGQIAVVSEPARGTCIAATLPVETLGKN